MRLAASFVALLALAASAASAELLPGGVLGKENWEEARNLLPDEFLESYRRGDFRHEIGRWTTERLDADPPARTCRRIRASRSPRISSRSSV